MWPPSRQSAGGQPVFWSLLTIFASRPAARGHLDPRNRRFLDSRRADKSWYRGCKGISATEIAVMDHDTACRLIAGACRASKVLGLTFAWWGGVWAPGDFPKPDARTWLFMTSVWSNERCLPRREARACAHTAQGPRFALSPVVLWCPAAVHRVYVGLPSPHHVHKVPQCSSRVKTPQKPAG
jgi:hypothetical protein